MVKIEPVHESNFPEALRVYTTSWRESHRGVCTPEFLRSRDYAGYLQNRMDGLFLISDGVPVGVFHLSGEDFGDLYIHPGHAGQGYGTTCVEFAQKQCKRLRLTVLSTNWTAIHLYQKMGFRFSGADAPLREDLWEREMIYTENNNG